MLYYWDGSWSSGDRESRTSSSRDDTRLRPRAPLAHELRRRKQGPSLWRAPCRHGWNERHGRIEQQRRIERRLGRRFERRRLRLRDERRRLGRRFERRRLRLLDERRRLRRRLERRRLRLRDERLGARRWLRHAGDGWLERSRRKRGRRRAQHGRRRRGERLGIERRRRRSRARLRVLRPGRLRLRDALRDVPTG